AVGLHVPVARHARMGAVDRLAAAAHALPRAGARHHAQRQRPAGPVAADLADRRPHAGGDRHRPGLLPAHAGLMTPVIALHGGAGTIRRTRSRPERAVLERALQAGYGILQDGGSSLEAVAAAVVIL